MNRIDFCLGLAFSHGLDKVALMKKNRPAWQKGKVNGIGGKIEEDELPIDAMVREFYEETGAVHYSFHHFAKVDFASGTMYCYKTEIELSLLETTTDEEIEIYDVNNLPENMVEEVSWLINLALSGLQYYEIKVFNS